VLATGTTAHKALLRQFPEHGRYFDYKVKDVDKELETMVQEIDVIRNSKQFRYADFKNENWNEAAWLLLSTWNDK
jgi:uncharacterized protein YecE (DUF72 family)